MILDALGGVGFVLALASIMGAFRSQPPAWGYPPVEGHTDTLPSVVLDLPMPRSAADSEIGLRCEA